MAKTEIIVLEHPDTNQLYVGYLQFVQADMHSDIRALYTRVPHNIDMAIEVMNMNLDAEARVDNIESLARLQKFYAISPWTRMFIRKANATVWYEFRNLRGLTPVVYLEFKDLVEFLETQGYSPIYPVTEVLPNDLIVRISGDGTYDFPEVFTVHKVVRLYQPEDEDDLLEWYDDTEDINGPLYYPVIISIMDNTSLTTAPADSLIEFKEFPESLLSFNNKTKLLYRKE